MSTSELAQTILQYNEAEFSADGSDYPDSAKGYSPLGPVFRASVCSERELSPRIRQMTRTVCP